MGRDSVDKGRNDCADSVPKIDFLNVLWEAGLRYERDVGPELTFKSTDLLEDAVSKLIGFYNSEYDASEQAEPGSTSRWILPEWVEKGVRSVRKIEAGDVVQIRKYWDKAADRGYFTCCAFVYDGQRARLHVDSSAPEFADQLRASEQKVTVPETVGDFANLDRVRQSNTRFVTLEISKYGRPADNPRHRRVGMSRSAAWVDVVPPAK